MENKIAVIGTGPGSKEYITVIGLEKIREAQVIVGAKRLLAEFALPHQKKFAVDKNVQKALNFIQEQDDKEKIAVLVTGDTGIYSLASYLKKHIPSARLEFYPGISSLQLMFARLKTKWNDAKLLSFHGQPAENAEKYILEGRTVGLLTDNHYTPQLIAKYFLDKGLDSNLQLAVGVNLSYPEEKIYQGSLKELANSSEDFTNSVVVFNYE